MKVITNIFACLGMSVVMLTPLGQAAYAEDSEQTQPNNEQINGSASDQNSAQVSDTAQSYQWGRWSDNMLAMDGQGNSSNPLNGPDWDPIIGVPSALTQIPVNATFTYKLVTGGTAPTPSDGTGGTLGTGNLIGGSATIDIANASIKGNMVMTFNNDASLYQTNYAGSLGQDHKLVGTTTFLFGSPSNNVCGTTGCLTQTQGQLSGTNSSNLGVDFTITTNQPFTLGGAAAYQR